MNKKLYNLDNIQTLLVDGLVDEELRNLCQAVPTLRSAYNQLSTQYDDPIERVNGLVNYVSQKNQFEMLLLLVQKLSPVAYQKYQPYYEIDASSMVSDDNVLKESISSVDVGDVSEGIHNSIFAGRDVTTIGQKIINIISGENQSGLRNRLAILDKVKKFWIKGVLEESLLGTALIELGLEEHGEAVEYGSWDLVFPIDSKISQPIPQHTKIMDVFEQMNHCLLIMGEPGGGKTMMLLEFARDAIAQAEQDPTHPIPVVFNLSSWANQEKPIAEWLVGEFNLRYKVPPKISRQWIENDDLLLLLDGLDEVKRTSQVACIEAINQFREEHGLARIIVCSRTKEYQSLAKRLRFNGAVLIKPLTHQQIDDYLNRAGHRLGALRSTLQSDKELQELAKTPLMLSVMSLAYQDMSTQDLITKNLNAPGDKRKHLFNNYIKQMFNRVARTKQESYPKEETINGLSWLAKKMFLHNQSEFLVEQLQPSWLSTSLQQWIYAISTGLVSGLIMVLVYLANSILAIEIGRLTEPIKILPTNPINTPIALFLYLNFENLLPKQLLLFLGISGLAGLTMGLRFSRENRANEKSELKDNGLKPSTKNVLNFGLITGLTAGITSALWGILTQFYKLDITYQPLLQNTRLNEVTRVATIQFQATALATIFLTGLSFGVIFGLGFGLRASGSSVKNIQPIETLSWSWFEGLKGIVRGIVIGVKLTLLVLLVIICFICLQSVIWYPKELMNFIMKMIEPNDPDLKPFYILGSTMLILIGFFGIIGVLVVPALLIGFIFGLTGGPIGGLIGGLRGREIETKTFPNQGIWQSGKNAVLTGIIFYLAIWITGGFMGGLLSLRFKQIDFIDSITIGGVIFGVMFAPVGALTATFSYGGLAVIQHLILRGMLYWNGHISQNYISFLDYATERIFLRKVGGGYIFVHRLILEHFVALQEEPKQVKDSQSFLNLPRHRATTTFSLLGIFLLVATLFYGMNFYFETKSNTWETNYYTYRGNDFKKQRNYNQTLNHYTKALELDPDSVDTSQMVTTLMDYGKDLAGKGKIDEATIQFQHAKELSITLVIDPRTKAMEIGLLALVSQGEQLAYQGEITQAITIFQQANILSATAVISPQVKTLEFRVFGLVDRGENLARQGQITQAVILFQQAKELSSPTLAIDPQTKVLELRVFQLIDDGENSARQDKITEAITLFQQAKELSPTLAIDPIAKALEFRLFGLVDRGENLARQGEITQAITIFQQIKLFSPTLVIDAPTKALEIGVPALVDRGENLARQGDITQAIRFFEQANIFSPTAVISPQAIAKALNLVSQGERLAYKGEITQAITLFQEANTFSPITVISPQAKAQSIFAVQQGNDLAYKGKIDEAIAKFQEAQNYPPNKIDADSWNNLCRQGSLRGQAQSVMFACEQAVKLAPDNGDIRDSRGLARALVGDYPGVIEDFEFYVQHGGYSAEQRKAWIKELKAGRNPITPAVLAKLRGE